MEPPSRIRVFMADGKKARYALGTLTDALAIVYILTSSIIIMLQMLRGSPVWLTPEYILFLFLAFVLLVKKNTHEFIRDFGAFALLFFAYEAMRGYAYIFNSNANFTLPIAFDLWLGHGSIPSALLQTFVQSIHLQSQADLVAMTVYSLHFLIPLLFGFVIWMQDRRQYLRYVALLLLVSYAALITFWLFPVAPPWMASERGLIDVQHRFDIAAQEHPYLNLPTLYYLIDANPVAAVPSLHFAYPFIAFCFSYINRKKAWMAITGAYMLLVGLSILYLGEHYVFDILAAIVYVLVLIPVSYALVNKLEKPGSALSAS